MYTSIRDTFLLSSFPDGISMNTIKPSLYQSMTFIFSIFPAPLSNIIKSDQIKGGEMDWTCNMHRTQEKCTQNFDWKAEVEPTWEDQTQMGR